MDLTGMYKAIEAEVEAATPGSTITHLEAAIRLDATWKCAMHWLKANAQSADDRE
jgi:hypothetical protein